MATVDGAEKWIFGWDVPGDGPAYRSFLEQFIPALRLCLPLGRSVSGLSGQGWRAAVVHPGREAVLQMIDRNAGMEKMTFKKYPTDASYLLELRCAVFEALEKSE